MSHRILSLFLLLSFCPLHSQTTRQKAATVNLDSPMLRAIDGTPFIHIGNIMYMGKQIIKLLSKEPLLYYEADGTYKTVRQLRQLEERTSEIDREAQESMDAALKQALDMLADLTRPYLEEIQSAKEHMIGIIDTWRKERDRHDTYLIEWANIEGNEEQELYRNIRKFAELEVFLNDLSTFLADLVQNCPISYAAYKQDHGNQKHGYSSSA